MDASADRPEGQREGNGQKLSGTCRNGMANLRQTWENLAMTIHAKQIKSIKEKSKNFLILLAQGRESNRKISATAMVCFGKNKQNKQTHESWLQPIEGQKDLLLIQDVLRCVRNKTLDIQVGIRKDEHEVHKRNHIGFQNE